MTSSAGGQNPCIHCQTPTLGQPILKESNRCPGLMICAIILRTLCADPSPSTLTGVRAGMRPNLCWMEARVCWTKQVPLLQ